MTMRPLLGQIVHFSSVSGACRAAMVTERGMDTGVAGVLACVTLRVFTPYGSEVRVDVPYDKDQRPGTWHFNVVDHADGCAG